MKKHIEWRQWRDTYYEASSAGDLRVMGHPGRSPSHRISNWGYRVAKVNVGGKFRSIPIHRIVFEAFHGQLKNGMVVNHMDCNKLNNAVTNLEQVTQKENVHHAVAAGRFRAAGRKPALSATQVAQIRELYRPRPTLAELAIKYDVSIRTIHNVVKTKLRGQ